MAGSSDSVQGRERMSILRDAILGFLLVFLAVVLFIALTATT